MALHAVAATRVTSGAKGSPKRAFPIRRATRSAGAVALLLVAAVAPAFADTPIDPCACSPKQPGFFRRSALTGDWGGLRDDLHDDGISLQATYAGEVFASPGLDEDLVAAGLAVAAVDADLKAGDLHVTGLAIHGHGLSSELMDVYGVSNNVADQDVRLFEAWYEQPIGDVAIRTGLVAADQEFVLAKHGTALINATFGIISQIPIDASPPVYPAAAPGVSVRYERAKQLTVRAALYDAAPDETHGIPTGIGDESLAIGEIELRDTLKLGAWHHSEDGNGYYAIADRGFAPRYGAFARLGYAPDRPVSLYIDTGIRIGPVRDMDFAAVGMAFARTADGSQTAVEATYQLQILGWLSIQPDLQLLLERDRTAAILATRVVVVL
jgi:carbohydrate-selective porin OprB